MNNIGFPLKQGLYDPQFEKDACGIGFVANMKGKKSHEIINQALHILCNLEHRGGQGAEANSGDGAGILIQIPDSFYREECHKLGFQLPDAGTYGVGMLFLSPDPAVRAKCEAKLEQIVEQEGQKLLGWRDVPTDASPLGESALSVMPYIKQLFIAPEEGVTNRFQFERKLYVIRKRAENEIRHSGMEGAEYFYFTSLSTSTIVYKGMLNPDQVDAFYLDLKNPSLKTALALVHSRFSTNTFPNWERAHPHRYIMHNGEINTLRGNVNWMRAREAICQTELFGQDMQKILPVIDETGSDSSMLDNSMEFLMLSGRSLTHAAMMMIPEPWQKHESMSEEKKAFYEYHSCLMEPWDGPTSVGFTDGKQIGAILDRNGLRPARYYVTTDDNIIYSSEVGVLDIAPEKVVLKERLYPGKMLLVDIEEGRIIADEELKHEIASAEPYQSWVKENLISLEELPVITEVPQVKEKQLLQQQQAFGYTYEEINKIIMPMAETGEEPLASMGHDSPLAILSTESQLLYNYFKQLFAQVTNPPIDAIREEIVTATVTTIGAEGNLVKPEPDSCRQIRVEKPIISNQQLATIKNNNIEDFKAKTLSIRFKAAEGGAGLKEALDNLFVEAEQAIAEGQTILILSDRQVDEGYAPIPALLAVAGLHHHLIREGNRTKASIIVESAEAREIHHFATLLGFGASLINPYLAFDSMTELIEEGMLEHVSYDEAVYNYIKAATKGIVKVLSKIGISTIQSYRGAQIFEALGIDQEVIDQYFTRTATRIGGLTLDGIAKEVLMRHERAFTLRQGGEASLPTGSEHQWRRDGEPKRYNPVTIHTLQHACRTNDYQTYKKYSNMISEEHQKQYSLRGLLQFKGDRKPVPLDEVESVESIFKRFKTGAMSYGSISKEAHETLAIAMNRIGGKSNTGEGGEDPARFEADENGDLRRSAIKQVASGRFGVTSNYLVNADEIQIKVAQGAKPGEGGQLPGNKVYPWVAEVRGSTPGVGLISPPPHHDIYSIEDLAQLIHDLKNANPKARISVKLVAEVGVGTIAAGVVKAKADLVLVSGYDGGTGAAPRTSVKHAGLPWELGIAETHQTLVLNKLRDRVVLETDGKLMSGRDVVMAALLGAEEFGFSTAPLVVVGCVMMRVCHMDTCPVGVATQNPELRKKFTGDADHVVNFMTFIAEEVREIMAELGFRSIEELVGRTELLEQNKEIEHWKVKQIDLSTLLHRPAVDESVGTHWRVEQDHGLEKSLDLTELLGLCETALEEQRPVQAILPIRNTNRVVGTILGSEVTRRYGAKGLPEDTIRLHFKGSAGQSFGAFVPKGISLSVEGDANDYVGKGLSGGKLSIYPSAKSSFIPEHNIIIGNVAFYGATSGEAYIQGIAGERFCVRNSGVHAVVEGVGDHGCEYMTGGRVVILGSVGRNFAAGMSGGIAYVLDEDGGLKERYNPEMVLLEALEEQSYKEVLEVKAMIQNHLKYTDSRQAQRVLEQWEQMLPKLYRVIPKDYKEMIERVDRFKSNGLSKDEALLSAFEEGVKQNSRVSGH